MAFNVYCLTTVRIETIGELCLAITSGSIHGWYLYNCLQQDLFVSIISFTKSSDSGVLQVYLQQGRQVFNIFTQPRTSAV